MSDRFERDLRDHLHREAGELRELPGSLRGRIRERIAPSRRSALLPQLAVAATLVLVAGVVLFTRNPQVVVNDVRSAFTGLFATPSPAPTPQPYLCEDRSGGATGIATQLTAVRVASHEADGYDRIVFEFSNGVPSYDLMRQTSASFVLDPSGQQVQLPGQAGFKLVFRDTSAGSGIPALTRPNLLSVLQLQRLGDFERVLSYGVGLSAGQCLRVQMLSSPSRLVIDVATSPATSPSPAPTPLPTVADSTGLPAFSCQDQSGGSAVATAPMQLTAVRVAHQASGYDRIVFEFAAPAGSTASVPSFTVSRQASAVFVKDPSGMEVRLQGGSGLRIVFHGASAAGSYTESQDIKTGLPEVLEVRELGDFESVLSWGVGLSQESCFRSFALNGPARLVIDVQTH